MKSHKGITGGGKDVNSESFFRYSQYHSLNIDQTPLLNNIIYETLVDWQENDISFQLSPYFSHSLNYLIYSLNQTNYLGINDPFFTMQSFYNKGWYSENLYLKKDLKKAMDYQYMIILEQIIFWKNRSKGNFLVNGLV